MIYNQYPFNIYNPDYVNQAYLQQLEAQRQQLEFERQQIEAQRKHLEQQRKIGDMVKAVSDFFKAANEIEPEYQQDAMNACLAEIAVQIAIAQRRNGGHY